MADLLTDAPDEQRNTLFADVILPLYLPSHTYTYRVPFEMNDEVEPGKRVVVQLGKKKIYAGLVYKVHSVPPKVYEAKYLHAVLDQKPVVTAQQLDLWTWMADYYMCTLGEVMDASMPSGMKLESETRIFLNSETEINYGELDDKEYMIVEALELQSEISIEDVSDILRLKNVIPIIKSLYQKGIVMIRENLVNTFKPKTMVCIRLNPTLQSEKKLQKLFDELEKKPKQLNILMSYLSDFKNKKNVSKKELIEKSKSSESVLKTLITNGIFEKYEVEIDRISVAEDEKEEYELDPKQEKSIKEIKDHFEKKNTVLLHGVTSSGKTLVYCKLIEEQITKGKQVLYLLPEVALTAQIINRLRKYFGTKVCVWHYKFNDFERVEIWNKILSGAFKVVIGTRSSVMLPFNNLGLVIVDEEHDFSYKQYDPAPRYQARDTAIYLASASKAKILLGTATPSVESYFNTVKGKYGLVKMQDRFGGMQLPDIVMSDVSESNRTKTLSLNFTPTLLSSIRNAVVNNEQVILFQNRRGYVPVTECGSCGWSPHCQNCDITLTYYKQQNLLKCHYCGFKTKPVNTCGACGSANMHTRGFGTEKLEDDLKLLLPEVRVSRLDFDTTRTKEGHVKIINEFQEHKIDVLVGTQMVSKGLDFENVRVVGIMDADQLLNFPDFRALERAFQLLIQVSGRAGRMGKQGTVVIQSRRINHEIFRLVAENNFEALFTAELQNRQKWNYPPYTRLIKIILKHKDQNEINRIANDLAQQLKSMFSNSVLGPEFNFIPRIQNLYIKNILLKLDPSSFNLKKSKHEISSMIHAVLDDKKNKGVRIYIDVDSY